MALPYAINLRTLCGANSLERINFRALCGLADQSLADMLRLRFNIVNFGAEQSPGSPHW